MRKKRPTVWCAATLLLVAVCPGRATAQQQPPVSGASAPEPAEASIQQGLPPNPLQPADTSSPRATLLSFLDAMNGSYRLIMEAHRLNTTEHERVALSEVEEMARAAEVLFERAVSCLDLSEVVASYRREFGYETAIQLKETFDRIELPAFDSVPDARDIEREKEEERVWGLIRWRAPGTDTAIAEVEEGPRAGEFLFTAGTIGRVAQLYRRAKPLPYKAGATKSEGFFDFYVSTPGRLLPPRWIQALPEWTTRGFLQQTVWQWFALGIAMVLGHPAHFQRSESRLAEHLRQLLVPPG